MKGGSSNQPTAAPCTPKIAAARSQLPLNSVLAETRKRSPKAHRQQAQELQVKLEPGALLDGGSAREDLARVPGIGLAPDMPLGHGDGAAEHRFQPRDLAEGLRTGGCVSLPGIREVLAVQELKSVRLGQVNALGLTDQEVGYDHGGGDDLGRCHDAAVSLWEAHGQRWLVLRGDAQVARLLAPPERGMAFEQSAEPLTFGTHTLKAHLNHRSPASPPDRGQRVGTAKPVAGRQGHPPSA